MFSIPPRFLNVVGEGRWLQHLLWDSCQRQNASLSEPRWSLLLWCYNYCRNVNNPVVLEFKPQKQWWLYGTKSESWCQLREIKMPRSCNHSNKTPSIIGDHNWWTWGEDWSNYVLKPDVSNALVDSFWRLGFSGGGCGVLCHPIRVKLLGCHQHVGHWSIWVMNIVFQPTRPAAWTTGSQVRVHIVNAFFQRLPILDWFYARNWKKAETGSDSGQEADLV